MTNYNGKCRTLEIKALSLAQYTQRKLELECGNLTFNKIHKSNGVKFVWFSKFLCYSTKLLLMEFIIFPRSKSFTIIWQFYFAILSWLIIVLEIRKIKHPRYPFFSSHYWSTLLWWHLIIFSHFIGFPSIIPFEKNCCFVLDQIDYR